MDQTVAGAAAGAAAGNASVGNSAVDELTEVCQHYGTYFISLYFFPLAFLFLLLCLSSHPGICWHPGTASGSCR